MGWDHVEKVDKHESQKDYKTGFGGNNIGFFREIILFVYYLPVTYLLRFICYTFVLHFCWYEISFDFFINNLFFRQIRCLHFQFRQGVNANVNIF